MKKFIIIITALILGLFTGFQSIAQGKKEKSTNNYILLTNNIEQLKPIFLTVQKLAEEDGKKFGEFQVVVCGKTVENLADAEKMKAILEMIGQTSVKLIVCGFSLNKFKVDATNIPKQFSVVENGILHNFQLQGIL